MRLRGRVRRRRWLALFGLAGALSGCATFGVSDAPLPTPDRVVVMPSSAAPTVTDTASPATSTPTAAPTEPIAPTETWTPEPPPEPAATIAPEMPSSPVESPAPVIVNTPLPGDGSVRPIGQHAYAFDVAAADLTRTTTISYLLYLPETYGQDSQQRWPLILFLHGSDVWGNDPAALTASGLPARLVSATDFPAIVLSPQVSEDVVWWGAELDRVNALLDHIEATYAVDAQREYLTGLSMGGFGVWAMAIRYPQRFAALAPVAGGWNSENDTVPRTICDLKDTPTWIFHGEQDDIVPVRKAQLMIEALKRCGAEPRVTLYADANHRQSFERAYADPELYVWLFEQRRP